MDLLEIDPPPPPCTPWPLKRSLIVLQSFIGRTCKIGQACFTHAGVSQALGGSDAACVRSTELKIRTSPENAEPSKGKSTASEQGLAPRKTHLNKDHWSRRKERCKTLASD